MFILFRSGDEDRITQMRKFWPGGESRRLRKTMTIIGKSNFDMAGQSSESIKVVFHESSALILRVSLVSFNYFLIDKIKFLDI